MGFINDIKFTWMTFYIDDNQIEESDLLLWANETLIGNGAEWIRDLASTIVSWHDKSAFINIKTSGSTGKPKTIRLSKLQMEQSALKTGLHFNLKKGMMTFNCLPCQYIAGKMMVIRALVLDLDQLCVEPKIKLDFKVGRSIDFAAMTPLQVETSLNNNRRDIVKIRKLIIGGAPIMPNLMDQIQEISTECYATYGMTETITHIAIARVNGPKASSIFTALDRVTFELSNGNLVILADHLDNPIVTTDHVKLICNISFEWLGRSDNVINKGGVKLHPEVIEKKLRKFIEHRFIVTGIENSSTGHDIALVIESPKYGPGKLEELSNSIQSLEKLERPKRIIFIESFQETPTGKIKRNIKWYTSSST